MKKYTTFAILIVWITIWVAFTFEVDHCKVLSSWHPRFGSSHESCDKIIQSGFVWAKSQRDKFQQ